MSGFVGMVVVLQRPCADSVLPAPEERPSSEEEEGGRWRERGRVCMSCARSALWVNAYRRPFDAVRRDESGGIGVGRLGRGNQVRVAMLNARVSVRGVVG